MCMLVRIDVVDTKATMPHGGVSSGWAPTTHETYIIVPCMEREPEPTPTWDL